jgi:transcription initiation factor TFIIIB Brf1 subunit/transcription initiation factor TFIIB
MKIGEIERDSHVSCQTCGCGCFTKVYNVTSGGRAEETLHPAYQCIRCGSVMAFLLDRNRHREVVGSICVEVNVEVAK